MSDAYDAMRREPVIEGPDAFIQWKGTTVCMDVHCSCGHFWHLDADFAYFVECNECKQRYKVGSHVPLIALTSEESASLGDDQVKREFA